MCIIVKENEEIKLTFTHFNSLRAKQMTFEENIDYAVMTRPIIAECWPPPAT